ncbi:MAG: hypothetical protein C4537_04275 [Acholeplasma sp.]|jgi:hypothetical protein|nr:MAG: hypothetical protein C4537_04275 [Acholeplasma sp.]
MEKIKTAFLDMLNNNKMKLYMFILYVVTFLFYLFGTLLPFMIDPTIIGGRASLSDLPLGGIFITVYMLLFLTTLLFYILGDKKQKLFFILTAIVMTLFYLFGAIGKGAFPQSTSGFGAFMTLLFMIIAWVEIFAGKFIQKLIEKNVPKVLEKIESLKKEESEDTIS